MTRRASTALEIVARELAGSDWRAHLTEAAEILAESEEVIEWRLGVVWPERVLHLAKLLAAHHAKQREHEQDWRLF